MTTILQKRALIFFITLILLTACKKRTEHEQKTDFTVSSDTIIVNETSTIVGKLKLLTPEKEPYSLRLLSAGTVKAIPNFYAEIAPPYSGRVTKVHLRLGMKVNPGTPLFEMISPDFTEIQKKYFASKTDLKKTELSLKRQKDLQNHGVGSLKDLEQAQAEYEIALREYQNSRSGLKVFNVNPEKLVLGQPLVITSPIKGEVIENEIVNGHFIKEDDQAHAVIAELNKVWVVGQVKEKDIRFIHELDGVEIEIAAYPDRKISGTVYHVDEVVDEETRSIRVLIECDNRDFTLKPGMYVTVNFIDRPQDVVFVPSQSIFQLNDANFIFIQTHPNKYVKRKVTTGASDNGRTIIMNGIKPGEIIVSEGGFYLLEAK